MIDNTLKEINVKDVNTLSVKGGLTIHIYKNTVLDNTNYYMSVLSHNIINHPLGTSDLMLAKSKAMTNLSHIMRQCIKKYNKTLESLEVIAN